MQSSTSDSVETMRIASAAQRFSKRESPRETSPRMLPHRRSGPVAPRRSAARVGAENFSARTANHVAAGAAEHNMIVREFLSVYAKKNGIAVDMPPLAAQKVPDKLPLIGLSSESDSDDNRKTPAKRVATGGVDVDLEADDDNEDDNSDDDKDDDDDDEVGDNASAGEK
jgi:hypothetical protein